MRWLKLYVNTINQFNDKLGAIVCVLILPMMVVLCWEVLMRYGFNAPTIWAHETSQYLFGAHFILGGAFALRWGSHVNVEILYSHFSLRKRASLDLFTWILFYLFCGFMLYRGWEASWLSITRLEHTYSFWGPPLWPLRLTIPLAAALILLQGLIKTVNDIYTAITGKQLVEETIERAEV